MNHLLQDIVKGLKSIIIRGPALSIWLKVKLRRWQKQSKHNVLWLERQSQEELIRLLSRLQCLILPSWVDMCADVVKEVGVMAFPVVASPHISHTQYIEHGQYGFICPFESAESCEEDLPRNVLKLKATLAMRKFMREEHNGLLRPDITVEGFLSLYGQGLSIFRLLGFA